MVQMEHRAVLGRRLAAQGHGCLVQQEVFPCRPNCLSHFQRLKECQKEMGHRPPSLEVHERRDFHFHRLVQLEYCRLRKGCYCRQICQGQNLLLLVDVRQDSKAPRLSRR